MSRIIHNRHVFVSYAEPRQMSLAIEFASTLAIDNGAFSFWKRGTPVDWDLYRSFVIEHCRLPVFDFAIIPDVIGGSAEENDELEAEYALPNGVPVFHQNEPLEKLERLVHEYPRVALGSVEKIIPSDSFNEWMTEVMDVACDADGLPKTKLHGLRMLNPEIFQAYPLASADSTNVAQNHNTSARWQGRYNPVTQECRAAVMFDRIEAFQSPCLWQKPKKQFVQMNLLTHGS